MKCLTVDRRWSLSPSGSRLDVSDLLCKIVNSLLLTLSGCEIDLKQGESATMHMNKDHLVCLANICKVPMCFLTYLCGCM